jgi:N utilization substance protein B
MAARRKGRILAFQALYWWEAAPVVCERLLAFPWVEQEKLDSYGDELLTFSRLLVSGTLENITQVDALIKGHVQNWDFSRIKKVDLAVLRLSIYSLLYQKELDSSIIIEEAIGLCLEFGDNDSFRFVNGVLDKVRLSIAGGGYGEAEA